MIQPINETLYVVSVISNSRRYHSRYKLFKEFQQYMAQFPNVKLYVVELSYGDRAFEITDSNNPQHIQLRTNSELWHKENLINIGVSRLPADWKYVAWIDGDVSFARHDWAQETIHMLQHHPVIQLWSQAIDLDPKYETIKTHRGFAYQLQKGVAEPSFRKYYEFAHPGFAWAATKEAWNQFGGMMDFCILGAADHHQAWAWVQKVHASVPKNIHATYFNALKIWEDRCVKFIKHDIGYVDGLLFHKWHGKKKDRKYVERWKILVGNNYNPQLDIKYDWQGVLQLTDRNPKLRDDIRKYFTQRNEDSIDID
jgi:hypothetical protein